MLIINIVKNNEIYLRKIIKNKVNSSNLIYVKYFCLLIFIRFMDRGGALIIK